MTRINDPVGDGTPGPAPRRRNAGTRPVMSDVAHRAGVSHQTVSRVLNEHPSVREQTRQRVLLAIAELGYRPNRIARALASRRFRSVGVVTSDTVAHGPASTLLGIERAARDRGWGLTVAAPAAPTRTAMREAVEAVLEQGPTGLLVIAPEDSVAAALPQPTGDTAVVWVAGPDYGDRAADCPGRPGSRRPAGHRAPARAGAPHGVARRWPGGLA